MTPGQIKSVPEEFHLFHRLRETGETVVGARVGMERLFLALPNGATGLRISRYRDGDVQSTQQCCAAALAGFCHWGWGFKSERVCLVSGGHASVRDRC
jgi:hypothetical protein